MFAFSVGQQVLRSAEPSRSAAVIQDKAPDTFSNYYLLSYPEGGGGWWPEDALLPYSQNNNPPED
jgi:hypothetical protein